MRTEMEAWAREVLADPKTAVLDTETTGLHGYVCEISVYEAGGALLDTLVNPQAPIELGAQRIHGLTAEKLATARPFGEIWPMLESLLADRRIVVWNAEFDSAVIRRELERLKAGEAAIQLALGWECAMRAYSDWYWDEPDARFMRLNGGHRAAEDCRAVFTRLREMAAPVTSVP
jgi:DNA polymerase III alpha subunit (gram-positive type)